MSHHAASVNEGLVCAFQLAPPGPCGDDVLERDPAERPVWLHFNVSNARARLWLQGRQEIPEEARQLLLSSDRRIHADVVDGAVVAVLGDLKHEFDGDADEGLDTLRVYLDAHRIITARHHPLRTTDRLRREIQTGVAGVPGSPFAMFEHLIERLADTMAALVSKLGAEVDDAEDEILSGRLGPQGEGLGRVRRTLARLRRHVNANRTALATLPRRLADSYDADQRQGLRQAVDLLDTVAQDLDLVQERARLVQEEIASRLGEATNRNLFLLSIVTTTLLPITLITGIFGMNVAGLPWLQDPQGFWWVIIVMLLALVITLLLLRRRRVL